jgi:hypothetical protein
MRETAERRSWGVGGKKAIEFDNYYSNCERWGMATGRMGVFRLGLGPANDKTG